MNKFCGKCGKENTAKSNFCPYCGETMVEKQEEVKVEVVNPETRTNGLALAGFIVSLGSLIISLWGITGIVGTILSIIGLVKTSHGNGKGKGFAIAGLIVGIISSIGGFILSIFYSLIMDYLYYL